MMRTIYLYENRIITNIVSAALFEMGEEKIE
jgi:hypothetical protein